MVRRITKVMFWLLCKCLNYTYWWEFYVSKTRFAHASTLSVGGYCKQGFIEPDVTHVKAYRRITTLHPACLYILWLWMNQRIHGVERDLELARTEEGGISPPFPAAGLLFYNSRGIPTLGCWLHTKNRWGILPKMTYPSFMDLLF